MNVFDKILYHSNLEDVFCSSHGEKVLISVFIVSINITHK